MRVNLFLVVVILYDLQLILCKNILAVFPHFGISHFKMYDVYVQKLAERGHKVTLIAWHNLTRPHDNVKSINFKKEEVNFNLNLAEYESLPRMFMTLSELQYLNTYGQKSCSLGLADPKVKDLIASKHHFDLVVVEYFNTDCFAVFSHIFRAPLIGIFSSAPMPWHNERMGNPDNPSYIVNIFGHHKSEMNFFQRVSNTLRLLLVKSYHSMFYTGATDKLIRAHLGKGIPKINKIISNTSVFLVNSHYSLFQSRPLVPGMIEVGGLHVEQPKKLPADLEKFASDSKKGFVYFSLGTVTKALTLPEKRRKVLLKTFANLSENVFWKWEAEEMPDKPKNVLIKKWFPQNDILAHPNIKLFVTHGGLMGIQEAVTYGVPMILIPLFGDQFFNAAAIEEKGAGVVLDYFSITEKNLLRTIRKVLDDKTYTDNAKLLAARFKERPLSPMNNAIYWTEYVLKFKGAQHLKPANVKLSWFSENLIDVTIFLMVLIVSSIYFGRKGIMKFKEIRKAMESQKKKKK